MSPRWPGCFVTVDGPSGVGKSTTIQALSDHLTTQGMSPLTTTEPTTSELGQFLRATFAHIRGHALACLVAADRYQHLDAEIMPALHAGRLVVSDRYLPSSLVLQQLDGVPLDFILALNASVPMPDLAVILTAAPELIADRIRRNGAKHRFRQEPQGPARETALYAQAADHLHARGVNVLLVDTSDATPSDTARHIADAITALPVASIASATDTPSRDP